MIDPCQWKFPLCPAQAGYSAQFDEGIISTQLDGGMPFMRLDVPGAPVMVNASWVLSEAEYCVFMGLYRDWARTGGDPFYIDLILETSQPEEYVASFVPGSIRLVSKNGPGLTVSAQLRAMPRVVDPCDDYCASVAILSAYYGRQTCEAVRTFSNVVNTLPAMP